MINKIKAFHVFMAIWAAVLSVPAAVMGQETIVYTGSGSYTLNNPQSFFGSLSLYPNVADSLFPVLGPSGNAVTFNPGGLISGGVMGHLYGGIGVYDDASNNTVSLLSGMIGTSIGPVRNVYGGFSAYAGADNNLVTIANARVYGGVYGVWVNSGAGQSNNNAVILNSGADIRGNIYGAYNRATGDVIGNSVVFNNGANAQTSGGIIAGGYSLAGTNISGNSVVITGGTIGNYRIFGGRLNGMTGTNIVADNTVVITGGTINAATGGIHGGELDTNYGLVSGKTVSISGGTITGDIHGGRTGTTSTGNVNDNAVLVSGGTVAGDIYGGYSGGALGTTMNNAVTLSNTPILNGGLWGGNQTDFTGNTLNLWDYTHAASSSVTSVQGFKNYNFMLPASLQGALQVAGLVDFTGSGGDTSTVTGVNIMGGGTAPQPGQEIPLLQVSGFTGAITNNNDTIAGKKGATLDVLFLLEQRAGDGLYAIVQGTKASAEAKTLPQGSLAGAAVINQGADLAAREGIREAVRTACDAERFALKPCEGFTVVSGGKSRYHTGSHVDVANAVLISGAAWGARFDPGRLTLGAFMEVGAGSYDTYHSFAGTDVRGDGDLRHLGGGGLAHMGFKNNIYMEGSVRIGSIRNKDSITGLLPNGVKADYKSSSVYSGAHLGGGYILNIGQKNDLDLYGKYFYTRLGGDDVTLLSGDEVKFKAVDSHRARLGGRFSHRAANAVTPYVDAAYEYEFDGKAKAVTYGNEITGIGLRGGTGILELGVGFKPSPGTPLFLDAGLQGYVGKREGVTGSLQARYEF